MKKADKPNEVLFHPSCLAVDKRVEQLEAEIERLMRAWYECPQDSVPDILNDVFQDIELRQALRGE